MIVVDASLMVARILSEVHPGISDDLYDMLDAHPVRVPSHWPVEIANALHMNIRRGRMSTGDVDAIISLLMKFHVTIDPPLSVDAIGALAKFADANALTAYDAMYVQTALDNGARLATLDRAMRAAAERHGVVVLPR